MKKKLLFFPVFCLILLNTGKIYAAGEKMGNYANPDTIGCNAPPPDSFRITGFGYGYVSLAWTPASPGDDHLITVYQEFNNNWDSIYSVFVENSSAYTINVPNPSTPYKFGIRTTCADRSPSVLQGPTLGPTAFVVDLTLNGRHPTQTQSPDCHNMAIPQGPSDWIGFEIYEMDEGMKVNSTLFEVVPTPNDPHIAAYVKRIQGSPNNKIRLVAANNQFKWPTNNLPIVEADLEFLVGKINDLGNFERFGFVTISYIVSNINGS